MEILLNTDTPTAKARWSVSKINKVYGLSNNSALNMLISKYVQEKKKILSDEDLYTFCFLRLSLLEKLQIQSVDI